jgi:hypothetical protein
VIAAIALSGVLVLYPLSIGPVSGLVEHDLVSQHRLRSIYRPLFWLSGRYDTAQDALIWYLRLWE